MNLFISSIIKWDILSILYVRAITLQLTSLLTSSLSLSLTLWSLRTLVLSESRFPLRVPMSYLGIGISPGNVAIYQGGKMKLIDQRVRLTEVLLRCSVSVFALLALILMVTDTQVKRIFVVEKRAKYTDMKSLV